MAQWHDSFFAYMIHKTINTRFKNLNMRLWYDDINNTQKQSHQLNSHKTPGKHFDYHFVDDSGAEKI